MDNKIVKEQLGKAQKSYLRSLEKRHGQNILGSALILKQRKNKDPTSE